MPPKMEKEVEPEVPAEPERGTGAFWVETSAGRAKYTGGWVQAKRIMPVKTDQGEVAATEEEKSTEEDEALMSLGKLQDGEGELVHESSGERFVGMWSNGTLVNGVCVMADGSVYKGDFGQGGYFKGKGHLDTAAFSYDGEWVMHKFHGKGVLTLHVDNSEWSGLFEHGHFVGGRGRLIQLKLKTQDVPPTLRSVLGIEKSNLLIKSLP